MLPVPLTSICTLKIEDDVVFVIGEQSTEQSYYSAPLEAFLFHWHTLKWYKVASILLQSNEVGKISCAYLRTNKSVIVAISNQVFTLNLSHLNQTWDHTSTLSPVINGVVFNIDDEEESVVILIGQHNTKNGSEIYEVTLTASTHAISYSLVLLAEGHHSGMAFYQAHANLCHCGQFRISK